MVTPYLLQRSLKTIKSTVKEQEELIKAAVDLLSDAKTMLNDADSAVQVCDPSNNSMYMFSCCVLCLI